MAMQADKLPLGRSVNEPEGHCPLSFSPWNPNLFVILTVQTLVNRRALAGLIVHCSQEVGKPADFDTNLASPSGAKVLCLLGFMPVQCESSIADHAAVVFGAQACSRSGLLGWLLSGAFFDADWSLAPHKSIRRQSWRCQVVL